MSDVDLALQVRDAGFLVGVTTDTTVAHLYKKEDAAILEPLGVHMNDNNEMHKKHVDYMTQKWGKFYTDSEVQKHSDSTIANKTARRKINACRTSQ